MNQPHMYVLYFDKVLLLLTSLGQIGVLMPWLRLVTIVGLNCSLSEHELYCDLAFRFASRSLSVLE